MVKFLVELENVPSDAWTVGQMEDAISQAIDNWIQSEGPDGYMNIELSVKAVYGAAHSTKDGDKDG